MEFTKEELDNLQQLVNKVKEIEADEKQAAFSGVYTTSERDADQTRHELRNAAYKAIPGLLDEIERLREALDTVYSMITREMAEPPGNERGLFVEIATAIEALEGGEE